MHNLYISIMNRFFTSMAFNALLLIILVSSLVQKAQGINRIISVTHIGQHGYGLGYARGYQCGYFAAMIILVVLIAGTLVNLLKNFTVKKTA